ncbi:MAG TPA: hypothetical protein PJ991_13450 [Kiritimatiellia bacterium]|nr:hypothetical protein [Kiritimatiellia bacterium]
MWRIFATSIFLLTWTTFVSGCANFRSCGGGDDWWGPDKKKHFAASAAIGAGTTLAVSTRADTADAAAIGFATATAAGAAKEWYDLNIKKTCWSWKDLVWDIIGASVGASLAAWAVD